MIIYLFIYICLIALIDNGIMEKLKEVGVIKEGKV
jgi:hypothetical protein